MPPLETCDLRQTAVLWNVTGQDRHGKPTVSNPIQIRVRWVLNDSQVVDPFGNTVASSGTVITDRPIDNMALMWLGKLVDLPSPPTDIHQVIKVNTTPDIKNRNTRFDYILMRYAQALPTTG
jgi:hypothetical protein